jgi:hypothetical protein
MDIPIITPWFFYLLNVIDGIDLFLGLISIISMCVIGVFGVWHFMLNYVDTDLVNNTGNDLRFRIRQLLRRSVIVFLITIALLIFLPGKSTIIQMVVASNVTPNTVELTKAEVKEAITFIVEEIKRLEEK